MKSTFVSLFAVASAVLVTETDFQYFTVTVNPSGAPPSESASTSKAVITAESSSATPSSVNNYQYSSSWSTSWSSSFSFGESSSSSPSSSPSSTTPSSSATPTPARTTSSSSSSSSSAAPTSSGLNGFEKDIVDYHNRVRAEHHVGDVTWSDKLAQYAQNYLNNDNCVFKHSGGPYGENIALGYPSTDGALDAWYNEEDKYNYSAGQFTEQTGHFTQMVWKGTNQVGCATVDCSGSTFLACEYYPRGNIIGHFTENVLAK